MEISLILRNIVAVGNFDPIKFDKFFFIKNKIFTEDELENGYFSEYYAQIDTDTVSVFISSTSISVTLQDLQSVAISDSVFYKIVENSTIFANAVGVNYQYYKFTDENIDKISRQYFYQDSKLVNDFFHGDDVAFGFYVSKQFKKARLKLDIKPQIVTAATELEQKKVLTFDFNFHSDLIGEDTRDQILEILQDVPSYEKETVEIMDIYND